MYLSRTLYVSVLYSVCPPYVTQSIGVGTKSNFAILFICFRREGSCFTVLRTATVGDVICLQKVRMGRFGLRRLNLTFGSSYRLGFSRLYSFNPWDYFTEITYYHNSRLKSLRFMIWNIIFNCSPVEHLLISLLPSIQLLKESKSVRQ